MSWELRSHVIFAYETHVITNYTTETCLLKRGNQNKLIRLLKPSRALLDLTFEAVLKYFQGQLLL